MNGVKAGLVVALMASAMSLWAQTPRIQFTAPQFYPEGTAYDAAQNVFYVSSVRSGSIGRVDAAGNYRDLYVDSTLKSGYGMKVDARRNRLWVCTGDANYSRYADSATFKKQIRLIGLDLATGRKVADVDLSQLAPGRHFANDLTLDDAGNIYITDSYAPVVYKVDAQLQASVFARSDWFASPDVGLNGIVWHPSGFLLVAHNSSGQLFRIDVAQPERIGKVAVPTFFPGADGLLLDAAGNLVLVQNKGVHKVFRLASKDGWRTAQVTGATLATDRFHQPTTATAKGGKLYVLNSKMNELADPTVPPSKMFSLQEVRFVPVQ